MDRSSWISWLRALPAGTVLAVGAAVAAAAYTILTILEAPSWSRLLATIVIAGVAAAVALEKLRTRRRRRKRRSGGKKRRQRPNGCRRCRTACCGLSPRLVTSTPTNNWAWRPRRRAHRRGLVLPRHRPGAADDRQHRQELPPVSVAGPHPPRRPGPRPPRPRSATHHGSQQSSVVVRRRRGRRRVAAGPADLHGPRLASPTPTTT